MFDSFYVKFGGINEGRTDGKVIVGFSSDGEDRTDIEVPINIDVAGSDTYDEMREKARVAALNLLREATTALDAGNAAEISEMAESTWREGHARRAKANEESIAAILKGGALSR